MRVVKYREKYPFSIVVLDGLIKIIVFLLMVTQILNACNVFFYIHLFNLHFSRTGFTKQSSEIADIFTGWKNAGLASEK